MPGLLPPDERYRQPMITQLKTLEDLGGVTVKVSGRQRHTVTITHDKVRSFDFKLTWTGGTHFVARTIPDGSDSPPVLALWTTLDVIRFAAAYTTLIELRAGRKTHGHFDGI
jgi:hypothetical protein